MKVAFGVLIALMLTVTMVTVSDVETADAAEPPISNVSYDSDVGGLIIDVPDADGIRAIVNASGADTLNGNAIFTDGRAVVPFDNVSAGHYNLNIRVQGYSDPHMASIDICELTIISGPQQYTVFLSAGDYTLKDYSDYGFQAPEGKEFGGWTFDGDTYQPGSTIEIAPSGDSYTLRVQAVWNDSGETPQTTVSFAPETEGTGSFEIAPEGPVTVDVGTAITENEDTLTIGDYTITAVPANGYEFSGWEYTGDTVSEDMTITAVFTETVGPGPTYYDVNVNKVTGGTASADPTRAEAGATITLTATPDQGYVFVEWQVSGGITVGDDGTFVMPAQNVTVTPVFEKVPVPVTGVTVTGDETAIERTTKQYTATVEPSDATDKTVTWSVSDTSVATVDQDGNVTFLTPGTVEIIAAASSGASDSIEVTVKERTATGISATVGVYDQGDTFRWDDVTVTVHYDNGQTETVETGYTIDLEDGKTLDTPGSVETEVHYNGMDCPLEITIRAPGQVVIDVTVMGGGVFGTLYVQCDDDVPKEFTSNGRITVDEGTIITITYDTDLVITPTLTLDGRVIGNGHSFTAESDSRVMISFIADDDDDEPVSPPVYIPEDDDDSTIYIVAVAAAAVVAILAALILMQTRKS